MKMGYFKKEKFKTSDSNELFEYFKPTIYKKDSIFIKGKEKGFIKRVITK